MLFIIFITFENEKLVKNEDSDKFILIVLKSILFSFLIFI